jgi:PAS domain S-box-containing protein
MASLVDPDGADDVETAPPRNVARLRPDAETHRRDLVANAGHELKTPLSIILGLSGRLIAAAVGDAGQHRDLERIRSNAYALLKQVDDLLEASRLEEGRAVVELGDCDVAALVRETAMGFQSLVEQRGQRLVLRTPGRLRARVDEGKLATVVSNLVANAIRYAPAGGVVRCAVSADGDELRLEVADSGPGIPPTERAAVFQRFHRVPGEAHARPGGTGLGLAIVRELVTLMDGTIAVGEAPEGGALLCVGLPFEPATDGPASTPLRFSIDPAERERATIEALKIELESVDRRRTGTRHAAPAGPLPRVLLVEPSPTLEHYLDELLSADYDVRPAATADEALRIAAETDVEAVIVDVGTTDGEALLGAVRREPLDGVPLVVLAGDPEQAHHLVRDRAVDYAIKPFADALLIRLGAIVGRRRAESARAAADARFRALFEHAPTGMALAGPDGRLLEINAALARMLGLAREAPLEVTLDDLTLPDDLLDGGRSLVPQAGDDPVRRIERRLVASDGRVVDAILTVSVIRDGPAPGQLVVQVEPAEPRSREAEPVLGALATQLARCVRYGERAALLLVDVPALDSGDAATRRRAAAAAVAAMRRRLRRSDALVRLGERRLAALAVGADTEAATAVGEDIAQALSEIAHGRDGALRATVGVRAFDAGSGPAQILADAERALASARRRDVAVAAASSPRSPEPGGRAARARHA